MSKTSVRVILLLKPTAAAKQINKKNLFAGSPLVHEELVPDYVLGECGCPGTDLSSSSHPSCPLQNISRLTNAAL